MDISDLWLQSGLPDSYLPGFRNIGRYNGKQYYLPAGYAWSAVYYNREIFDTYHLQPPTTWDEFLIVADTLQANNIIPFALAGRNLWSTAMWFDYLNLRLNGPDFRDALVQGQERFDDLRVREVFETWRFLLDSGYFAERTFARGDRETWRLLFSGEAAMIMADPIDVNDLPGQIRERLDFFPFPIMDPTLPLGEITPTFGYLVPAKTAHPLESLEFLRFISSPEVQSAMAEQFSPEVGVLPVYKDIDPETIAPEVRAGYELARQAVYFGQPYVFSVSEEMAQATSTALTKFLEDPNQLDLLLVDLEQARQSEFSE
jgi:multiple sugar transport system substrate-binding protein/raffinose/stachyose/melibiose transport system substrate-binding protein